MKKLMDKVGFYGVAGLYLVLFGFPFVITIVMSFKSQMEFLGGNFWGFPSTLFFGNFARVFASNFPRYFANSVFVTALSVTISILAGSLASYAIARLKLKYAPYLLLFFMVGMMIPVHTTLVPIYQLTKAFGLIDSHWGLILPFVNFSLPIAIYIMTSFFREISISIQESAIIDGASPFTIYWKIMLPLSTPAISTVAIYNFLTCWNEFIYSMTLLNTERKKTLPLGIREFFGSETVNIPAVLTAILIASLPIIIFYIFAQEKVVNGLSAGAIKG
ncbi:Trehalose transport system permease protein SugB [bioreactor metagenome]|jgi:raffinose/stachyose/melibiose transport system permease protein|uniref:Trehalose transport system permease protein SugB n=1 Tax=bioreactor metagenome TaxID=1076179 RepID=A0A644ZZV2_9ZZZZ|nr:carbohydrate ABC transporter permease [Sphaerochaeta sp.]